MTKTALFIGRFQPFHNGHLSDIKQALKENDNLIISIGSANKQREENNPFTLEERKDMILAVLKQENINNYQIIEDKDVGDDQLWMKNIKENYPKFDTLYSGNPKVKDLFQKHNLQIKDVNFIPGISSTKIRELIKKQEVWDKLVPKVITNYIKKHNLIEKI